jgi:tetratricopeptide (TPR) repeat protein
MGAPSSTENSGDASLNKPSAVMTDNSFATYSSLVQQYLSLFLIDNAIFLAERCVAEHPGNAEALYLLALCYHRSGAPKRAQLCLRTPISNASRFLAALCLYELHEYIRSEEVLLQECRLNYKRITTTAASSEAAAVNMDNWILQTSVSNGSNGWLTC